MTPHRPHEAEDGSDELPPSEASRARRRDHDATAGARSGMRTGLAKQFKQVLDAQAARGREAEDRDAERRPSTRPSVPRHRHRADTPD